MRFVFTAVFFLLLLLILTRKRRLRAKYLRRVLKSISRKNGFRLKRDWLFRVKSLQGRLGNIPVLLDYVKTNGAWKWHYHIYLQMPKGTKEVWKTRRVIKAWFVSRNESVFWTGDLAFDHRFERVEQVSRTLIFPNEKIRECLLHLPEVERLEWLSDGLHLYQDPLSDEIKRLPLLTLQALEEVEGLPPFDLPVLERLERDYEMEMQSAVRVVFPDLAVRAFGRIGSGNFLRKIVEKEKDSSCVLAAVHLGSEGLRSFLEKFPGVEEVLKFPPDVLSRLIKAFRDERFTDGFHFLCLLEEKGLLEIRLQVLSAIASFDLPQSRAFLEQKLSDPEQEIKIKAIELLGKYGSVESVESLYGFAGVLLPGRLRTAARQSIARIQSRLGEVERGWLTVDDDNTLSGALSEVDLQGVVSLSEDFDVREEREGE